MDGVVERQWVVASRRKQRRRATGLRRLCGEQAESIAGGVRDSADVQEWR